MCADLFKQTCEFVVSRGEFVVSRSQLYRLTPKFFRATSVISYAVKSTENTSDAEKLECNMLHLALHLY